MVRIFFLWLCLLPLPALSQYHTQSCKDVGLSGQVCITKDKDKNQSFNSKEIFGLAESMKKNPSFPWMQVIDQTHELSQDLEAEINSIDSKHRTRYAEILKSFKTKAVKPDEALEAIGLFLKAHSHHKMTLNNSDKTLMEQAANLLNGKPLKALDQSAGVTLGAGPVAGDDAGKR